MYVPCYMFSLMIFIFRVSVSICYLCDASYTFPDGDSTYQLLHCGFTQQVANINLWLSDSKKMFPTSKYHITILMFMILLVSILQVLLKKEQPKQLLK